MINQEKDSGLEFIGTKEIARIMGCSLPVARAMMREKSFPLIKVGKNYKCLKLAFVQWASERRA